MKQTLNARQIALYAMLGAMLFAAKVAMMQLPNIEPVSLLVMLLAGSLGWQGLYPVYLYVFLEFALWGIHLWSISYLYVWLLLFTAAYALRQMTSPLGWAVLSGGFGLLFGALCAPVYLLTGGWAAALSWWISGLPWDLAHGAGNFVMALVLFRPLQRALEQIDCYTH